MNVLSLFDGISCGRVALEVANIKVDKYFASEIDKFCIKVSKHHYPDSIHLGDVSCIKVDDLDKIDLLIGGSPCQGFSFAGKQLNFKDARSALFFEYVRVLNEIKSKNPDVLFLLENVNMKKEYQDVISSYLGVEPIVINSSLVSAQLRKRLYWTNIKVSELPKDKGIVLSDIIEEGFVDRQKSFCLDANYFKGGNIEQYFNKSRRQLVFGEEFVKKQYPNGKLAIEKFKKGIRSLNQKSLCLTSSSPRFTNSNATNIVQKDIFDQVIFRKLTPLECERLQTLPDNYTNMISNAQRYKALGNGWTVDVISHILSFI